MELNYRLLCKSYNTCLLTSLPVFFYGMPDGSIYAVYARFYEINFNKSGLEFVFAKHEEFTYGFAAGKILKSKKQEVRLNEFKESLEKSDNNYKIIKSYRNLNSFVQAQMYLNKIGKNMIEKAEKSLKLVS